jgi:hypothetical protein
MRLEIKRVLADLRLTLAGVLVETQSICKVKS